MAENIDDKFLNPYDPKSTENKIYKVWEDSGFFNPDNLPDRHKESFSIVMPPPNVTGVLHMGHALMITVEDILVRYKRMRGFKTLWIPGTDHAAIATQSKVEKELTKKEKKNRHDLGREEFLKRVDTFAQESHDTITSQIKVMGASCDWSREAFTLDEIRSKAVVTVFEKMYKDGLIYRKNRIVNWDPKGQTTISDDEIVREERPSTLYTFKYSKDFPISISTTRPETKVGDVAVAVHPDDKRYTDYVGKEFDAIFCGVPIHIQIVADKDVDMDFGTGAVGVTPAHSMTDWEIAERHDLPTDKIVINEYAKMTVGDDRILNKKTTVAREAVVEWLKSEELMEDLEQTAQNVATAERTGGVVEPLPKLQWFIDVNKKIKLENSNIKDIDAGAEVSLKDIMKAAVESGQVEFLPEHFSKTYFHWIENLRDWCISRQIWYGHRIPVYYRKKESNPEPEIHVGEEPDNPQDWEQDPDTLDTWFSAGLWTFTTLGWPHYAQSATRGAPGPENDLANFHPTDVLETGYEIIFAWVARMILMTGYNLGEVPFKTIYLHGTVRDAKGRKMSKSLGNGIDPIDIAERFGADAGRMALIFGVAPGTDSRVDESKIKGYKNFSNKIWNITRFVLENASESQEDQPALSKKDIGYIQDFKQVKEEVTVEMEKMFYHIASEKVYHYIWHTLADVILEEMKPRFESDDNADKESAEWTLMYILKDSLKMLHPFMPFVTEEIWGSLPGGNNLLMIEEWPTEKKD